MIKYSKIRKYNFVYYINEEFIDDIDLSNIMQLSRMSDFVINTTTNTVVKSRYTLEDIVDLITTMGNR